MKHLGKALRLLLLVIVLVVGAGSLLWAIPDRTIAASAPLGAPEAAAQLYTQGDYALSAQAYSQLIDQGYGDVALYFNRGLAYHEAGDTASALVSLHQAGELAPRNAQIRAALDVVEATASPTSVGPRGEREETMLSELTRWITSDELALAALGFWLLLTGAATVWILQKSLTYAASH